MGLSGTEADILNSVAMLRRATKSQIRKQVGFSLNYVGFLCHYLLRRGYLMFTEGQYSLSKEGVGMLLTEKTAKIDKSLIKEVAGELVEEIRGELKKVMQGIKLPAEGISGDISRAGVKIKTDFEFPVEDESLTLESNIDKIGTKQEKEKSDIDKSVELFTKIQKRRN